jgi:hypothetical protein
MNGRNTIEDAMATRDAIARTVAEPVFSVTRQTRANCAATDPTSAMDCPDQIVKKRVFHRSIVPSSWSPDPGQEY